LTYYPAVDCAQVPFIKNDENLEPFYRDIPTEPGTTWCPGEHSFEIDNDPWLTSKGKNYLLGVNYCDVAAKSLGLDDSGCEKDHAIVDAYLENVTFVHRILSEYFTPTPDDNQYLKKYIPVQNFISVSTGSKIVYIYNIQKHVVNFSHSRLFDFSSIPFISSGFEDTFYDVPFKTI